MYQLKLQLTDYSRFLYISPEMFSPIGAHGSYTFGDKSGNYCFFKLLIRSAVTYSSVTFGGSFLALTSGGSSSNLMALFNPRYV